MQFFKLLPGDLVYALKAYGKSYQYPHCDGIVIDKDLLACCILIWLDDNSYTWVDYKHMDTKTINWGKND